LRCISFSFETAFGCAAFLELAACAHVVFVALNLTNDSTFACVPYSLPQVAGARHGALFQRFIVALTRGGPGGLPRPIEIHAHDPRRYVADMLAWVHQVGLRREFCRLKSACETSFGCCWHGRRVRARLYSRAALWQRSYRRLWRPAAPCGGPRA
jgi:hypothetical protein